MKLKLLLLTLLASACSNVPNSGITPVASPIATSPPLPISTIVPQPTVAPTGTPLPTLSPSPIPSSTPSVTSTKLNIGVNLASPSYWDAQSMYADVTNYTSGWWADNTGLTVAQVQPFSVTSDNYPTTDAQVLSNFVGYPTGMYTISYEHDSNTKVVVGWNEKDKNTRVNSTDTVIDMVNNITRTAFQMQMTAGNPIMMYVHRIDSTKTSMMLRNMHVMSPDASGSFRTPFLAKLSNFSTIRMMGMNNTNDAKTTNPTVADCPAKNWNDRTVSSNFSRSNNSQVYQAPARDGATYEEEIELANTLKKDIWVNVPDCATDDFVTQMATLFHSKLNNTSKLYIEYSNETWNTGFGQWANIAAVAKTVAAIPGTDDTTRVQQYTAYRIMNIAKIFQTAFSDRLSQVKPVLAGQMANMWTISVGLDFIKAKYGDPKQWISYVSGAPYFGPMSADWASYDTPMQVYFKDSQTALKSKLASDQAIANADLSTALTALFATIQKYQTTNVNSWYTNAKTLQTTYSIPFVAYEGGQSLVAAFGSLANQSVIQPDGTTKTGQTVYYQYTPMFIAQSDSRMALAYDALLNGWQQNFGSNLFMHLGFVSNSTNWGYWGLLENLSDTSSTKWNEVIKLMSN